MTADDIYNLMKALQAQLEIILKREEPITRAELAEYIKVVRGQAVPVQDPVKLAQQLLPELLAQLPKQVPLKIELKTEEIVRLLSPAVNSQVAAIETTNQQLLRGLTQHLAAIDATLATRLQALKEREESLRATAAKVPSKVEVNIIDGFRNLALVAFGPLLFVLAMLGAIGVFSKEPVDTYNAVVRAYGEVKADNTKLAKHNDSLQRVELAQRKELDFYRTQVRRYRKKFPKRAADLPLYSPVKK